MSAAITAAILEQMAVDGATAAQLVNAAKAIARATSQEAEEARERAAEKREKTRVRNIKWRESKVRDARDASHASQPLLPNEINDRVTLAPVLVQERYKDHKEPTEKERSEKKKNTLVPKPNTDAAFAEFWLAYPRREGDNPKKPARLLFDRAIAKGVDPRVIIAGAKLLALEHPTPTRFVPMAKAWLHQERYADAEPVITGQTFVVDGDPFQRLCLSRYRDCHDGHDPDPCENAGKHGYMFPTEWLVAMRSYAEEKRKNG